MKWGKSIKARRPVGFIEPCIPTVAAKVGRPNVVREIKHDGYRVQLNKRDDRVRFFTRRGFDWSERYPCIMEAARSFVIDGQAVVAGERGIADFEKLHSREHDKSAMLWAFDLRELNGEDLRQLPLDERKSKLAKLLRASRHSGIILNEHLEADVTRAFLHPCSLGFEGIVSNWRDSPYVSGRSKTWGEGERTRRPAVSRSGCIAVVDGTSCLRAWT